MIGVLCDWRFYRIPNVLCLCMAVTGLLFSYWENGLAGLGQAGIGMLIPMALLYVLFYCGMLGAGDIKFLAAAGTFYGKEIGMVIVLSFLFNGILAVAKIWRSSSFHERYYYFLGYVRDCQAEKRLLTDYRITPKDQIHFSVGIFLASITIFIMAYQTGAVSLLSGILR